MIVATATVAITPADAITATITAAATTTTILTACVTTATTTVTAAVNETVNVVTEFAFSVYFLFDVLVIFLVMSDVFLSAWRHEYCVGLPRHLGRFQWQLWRETHRARL